MITTSRPRQPNNELFEYLEIINRLPLDKAGKLEFVKCHVERLKQYEQETKNNKNNFNKVLEDIKTIKRSSVLYCECCEEKKEKI